MSKLITRDKVTGEQHFTAQGSKLVSEMIAEKQQLAAWQAISSHPFFRDCYNAEESLIGAMIAKLDREV